MNMAPGRIGSSSPRASCTHEWTTVTAYWDRDLSKGLLLTSNGTVSRCHVFCPLDSHPVLLAWRVMHEEDKQGRAHPGPCESHAAACQLPTPNRIETWSRAAVPTNHHVTVLTTDPHHHPSGQIESHSKVLQSDFHCSLHEKKSYVIYMEKVDCPQG